MRRPRPTTLLILTSAIAVHACASGRQARAPRFTAAALAGAKTDVPEEVDAVPTELPGDANLDDLLRYAALHNPGLRAAYERWMAALERIPQAEALPDPRVSYGYYFTSVETFTGPQRGRLRGSQEFPWIRKLLLRGDVAARAAEAERLRFESRRLALFDEVTRAYTEYYYLHRAIGVTEENVAILQDWEALIRAKYRVATGSYPDLINTQIELGKLDDRLRTLQDLRRPTLARLNDVLGRPSTAAIPPPRALPAVDAGFAERVTQEGLTRANPELRSMDATIEEHAQRTELAWQEYFPDVNLGVEWIDTGRRAGQNVPNAGDDPVIGLVSLNLPVWWQK